MKKKSLLFCILLLLLIPCLIFFSKNEPARESITYFPADPSIKFTNAKSELALSGKSANHQYTVLWKIGSEIGTTVFLREDIGLLYANGLLVDKMGKWMENADRLEQQSKIPFNDSHLLQAVAFHHAEVHGQGETITSSQTSSVDQIYIVDSAFSPLHSFRSPLTKDDQDWKRVLDKTTERKLNLSWQRVIEANNIETEKYHQFSLFELLSPDSKAFENFPINQALKIKGSLLEGLYKNYYLGIKKKAGTFESPAGSTMPLILLANDNSHLLVLFETKNGEPILLLQKIEG